jgi:hypothetical protein
MGNITNCPINKRLKNTEGKERRGRRRGVGDKIGKRKRE